ncbi:hypothetical protein [Pontibacter sp. SGAir0037]|uniref:hypothetical protein n=1 Tax=Pontibacter sp. SGAir0037 TaxID=2571030 RepID=UPI001980BF04|nr:hypothetical protein [Pontibacter sp. SGAir0037]
MLALVFLFSPFTGACNTAITSNEADDMPQQDFQELSFEDTLSSKVSRSIAANTYDLLGNPIIADRKQGNKLEAYFVRINADFTLDAMPIENRHKPDISDTIYTIRFGESVLELYAPTQTGDLLLQDADIRNTGIILRNNMKVGMSQPELMTKLKAHDVRILQTTNEVVATTAEGAPIALRFYLKNGKVNRIRYESYVD